RVETDAQLDDYIEVSFSILPQIRSCPFHDPASLSVEDFYFKYHYGGQARIPGGPVFGEALKSMLLGLAYLEPGETKTFDVTLKPDFSLGWDLIEDSGWFYTVAGESAAGMQVQKLTLSD